MKTAALLGVLCMAGVSLAGPERVYYVAPGTINWQPLAPEAFVASMQWPLDDPENPPTISNYKCEEYPNGCPANSAIIDRHGNLGCQTGCTGSCTVCSGSIFYAWICKKGGPGCIILATTYVNCGTKATNGTCFFAGAGGDNMGCGCSPPASYPPEPACRVAACLYEA